MPQLFHQHDTFDSVNLHDIDGDQFGFCRRHVFADVVGADWKLAVSAIDQHRELDGSRAAVSGCRIQSRAGSPSGIENIIDEDDIFPVDIKVDVARMNDRIRLNFGQIVAIERNIQFADRNRDALNGENIFGKALRGQVSGESAIKPEYTGDGILVLEPTYKHILLIDLDEWGNSIVLDDGLFLACDSRLKHKAVMHANISSAVAGGEGLFNLGINGSGILCLESLSPKEELIEVTLKDDVLKVDGNMAIAWSGTLDFTVERSGKSLIGSAASGEGLVNVYRGTGKVLMAPVNKGIA